MKRSQFIILQVITVLIVSSCSSQSTESAENLAKNKKREKQIAEYIVDIFEDKNGSLWFGTMAKGAVRYDGKSLTYFTEKDGLLENTVFGYSEDSLGDLWFGSHKGVTKYDGVKFKNFSESDGISGFGCSVMVLKNGEVWAKSNNGVFRFDGEQFIEFELPNPPIKNPSYKWELGKVWSFLEDSKGNLWFGRDGYGACRYDGKDFKHFTVEDGLVSNNVSSILEDKSGDIWFSSLSSDFPEYKSEGGLSRFDGVSMEKFDYFPGLSNNDIYTLYNDKDGDVWIGSIGHGVYRYDGTNFKLFNKTDRIDLIEKFALQGILRDSKNRMWMGFSGGLFRLEGDSLINITQSGPWQVD